MAIIRWRPWDPIEEMEKAMEESHLANFPGAASAFTPALDIYQTKDDLIVETPLAGVSPDEVEISIENNVLTVKGKAEKHSEVEEKDYYRKEVRSGSFYRAVHLPVAVLGDRAKANSENGILKISIPKAPEAKSKAVKVKVGSKRK